MVHIAMIVKRLSTLMLTEFNCIVRVNA